MGYGHSLFCFEPLTIMFLISSPLMLRKGKALDTRKNLKALSCKAHLTRHYKLMMTTIKAIPCPHVMLKKTESRWDFSVEAVIFLYCLFMHQLLEDIKRIFCFESLVKQVLLHGQDYIDRQQQAHD
ncbi:hypothetical protein NC652_018405 [Populus alba x Populus x berolinensis]|nr:hypothetical protein NC652_018405 [Populus alba x Populus x berolinensis]